MGAPPTPGSKTTLRAITDADQEFLCRLYASTRSDEMALVPWSDEEKESFLRFQFDAQHRFYMEQFRDASFDLILLDGEPVGRLYVDRREDEIRLIDIALMPERRGAGLGSALLREIQREADGARLAVRIHVEQNNPALRLYHRLGFESIEEQGVYYLMEWCPEGVPRTVVEQPEDQVKIDS